MYEANGEFQPVQTRLMRAGYLVIGCRLWLLHGCIMGGRQPGLYWPKIDFCFVRLSGFLNDIFQQPTWDRSPLQAVEDFPNFPFPPYLWVVVKKTLFFEQILYYLNFLCQTVTKIDKLYKISYLHRIIFNLRPSLTFQLNSFRNESPTREEKQRKKKVFNHIQENSSFRPQFIQSGQNSFSFNLL